MITFAAPTMLVLLSPAKSLDETPQPCPPGASVPVFAEESKEVMARLARLTVPALQQLMGISDSLAGLNHHRHRRWAEAERKAALFLFDGEAYRGLEAHRFTPHDLAAAQRQLRILSGLYGVLRPLDMIAPHRLEMGTKLAMGRGRRDLYAFWGERITRELARTVAAEQHRAVVNLASVEYMRSVQPAALPVPVITPVFMEQTARGPRVVTVYAKHQRGAMAHWIIRHRMADPLELRHYDLDGYRFVEEEGRPGEMVFLR